MPAVKDATPHPVPLVLAGLPALHRRRARLAERERLGVHRPAPGRLEEQARPDPAARRLLPPTGSLGEEQGHAAVNRSMIGAAYWRCPATFGWIVSARYGLQ